MPEKREAAERNGRLAAQRHWKDIGSVRNRLPKPFKDTQWHASQVLEILFAMGKCGEPTAKLKLLDGGGTRCALTFGSVSHYALELPDPGSLRRGSKSLMWWGYEEPVLTWRTAGGKSGFYSMTDIC